MSKEAQEAVGEAPELYWRYFASRFEPLLMHIFRVIMETEFSSEVRFRKFFTPPV